MASKWVRASVLGSWWLSLSIWLSLVAVGASRWALVSVAVVADKWAPVWALAWWFWLLQTAPQAWDNHSHSHAPHPAAAAANARHPQRLGPAYRPPVLG